MSNDNDQHRDTGPTAPTPPDVARTVARRVRVAAPDWQKMLRMMGLEEAL